MERGGGTVKGICRNSEQAARDMKKLNKSLHYISQKNDNAFFIICYYHFVILYTKEMSI